MPRMNTNYDLTPEAINDVIEQLNNYKARAEESVADLELSLTSAWGRRDVTTAIVIQRDLATLHGKIDSYGLAVAAVKTRTRVGMEETDEYVSERSAKFTEAQERATCSICMSRTYRGERCVCTNGGDAEDYDEVLAELGVGGVVR